MKKIVAVLMTAICFVMVFAFAGCESEADRVKRNSIKDGYFKYYYIKKTDSYAIVGDGDIPYPETLAIPAYYNGKAITDFYYIVSMGIYVNGALGPSLENVKKVYYPFSYETDYSMTRFYEDNLLSSENFYPDIVFCVNNKSDMDVFRSRGIKIYYTKDVFENIGYNGEGWSKETFNNYKIIIYNEVIKMKHCEFQIANTSYMFNYEGAPNDGYFFINDFDRGGLIENTPYEPQREGYDFGGWYREEECINKWDFEEDKLSEAKYDEDGYITDFVETKLYAKWIKN